MYVQGLKRGKAPKLSVKFLKIIETIPMNEVNRYVWGLKRAKPLSGRVY